MTTFLEAPNTTHITTDLLIVSRVVYIRYLGLIFPKASGKRATDLLDAWLHLWKSSESPAWGLQHF